MQKFGIDADHVVSHYDVCAKNCPSAIRAKGDWNKTGAFYNMFASKIALQGIKYITQFITVFDII